MINLPLIRRLLREGSTVVLLEEGHTPLVVRQLRTEEPPEEVPIASRWPKGLAMRPVSAARSVFDGRAAVEYGGPATPEQFPEPAPAPQEVPASKQEQILERLNKEILALKEQLAQEEAGGSEY